MDWFNLTFLWYLQTTIAAVALAPLAFWLCRNLTDRGASFVRPLTSLLLVWPVWYLAGIGDGIVPFTRISLWISIIVLGLAAWFLAFRLRLINRPTIQHFLIAEAGFLACFAAFIWFHGYGPEITSQEKSSDLMMLASAMRSESMPPADAWFAGHTVNYYYLGYVIFGAFGKMIDAAPAETFNLALATIFGMSVVAAAGLAGNIIGKWGGMLLSRIGGILAAALILVCGNPWAAFTWFGNRTEQWQANFFYHPETGAGAIGWNATRILPSGNDTTKAISEFPAFSFILADLHPHMMALPFAITALGIAWMLANLPASQHLVRNEWPRLVAAGGFIGALYALNAWDFPTYLALGLLALLWGTMSHPIRERLIAAGIVVVSSLICWLPFYLNFEAPTRQADSAAAEQVAKIPVIGGLLASVAGYTGERSSFGDYFSIFGFAWTIAIVLIVSEFYQRRDLPHDRQVQNILVGAGVIITIAGLIAQVPLLIVCGLPIIAIWLLLERDSRLSLVNVSLALFGAGFALNLIPEFFYLIDVFNTRMNTIFKVYYQIWLLTALAAALAVIALVQTYRAIASLRYAIATGTAVIVALGIVFPIVAGNQWLNWRNPERDWTGINGIEYMKYTDPGTLAAIDWLRDNAKDDDVLLAAGGCDWSDELGRASGGSGVPAVIGWWGHEWQWHLGDDETVSELTARASNIPAMYEDPASPLLEQYGVTLIYVGWVETRGLNDERYSPSQTCAPGPFPNASNPDFPGPGWTKVFDENGSQIYRRDGT